MNSDLFYSAKRGVFAGTMVGLLVLAGCAAGPDSSTDGEAGGLTGDSANGRCDKCPPPPPPPAKNCQYNAFARAVDVHLLQDLKIPLLNTDKFLSQGGIHLPLSDASVGPGAGSAKADLVDLKIPNLLRLQVLDAQAKAGDCQSSALAEIAKAEVGLHELQLLDGTPLQFVTDLLKNLGLEADIQADVLKATASASCDKNGKPVFAGDSEILKLRIGPNNIISIVPGKANQTIQLLGEGFGNGIYIVINEQITETKGNSGSIRVNALHVNVLDLVDVVVSAAEAGITCGPKTAT